MDLKKSPSLFLLVNFLFTLHFALTSYINSSFLALFVPITQVGFLFSISALLSLIVLSYLERFLIRFSERIVTLVLLFLDIVALGVLSWHGVMSPIFAFLAITAFIVHTSIALFILRTVLDIYFEEKSSDKETGVFRGELLTSANIAWVLSSLIVSQILFASDFWKPYSIAFFITSILFLLLYIRMPRRGVIVKPIFFLATIKSAWQQKDISLATLANFLMHFYFSWMIIYLVPHLEVIGFSKENVYLIISVMLLPYVLVDIPLGKLVDRYGEKTFLFFGFLIMAIFTLVIGMTIKNGFLFWAVILFATRIGAAMVELTTDTYFFRHVQAYDGNMISFYRYAQPLAYIVGPLLASILLLIGITETNLFTVLSGITLLGIIISFFLTGKLSRKA